MKTAGLSACIWIVAASASAQTASSSAAMAGEVVSLMTERTLDTFAVQDPAAPNRYIAALMIPNAQLLVVSAEYPVPDALKALLAEKKYRDVYAALHQPASAPTRFFLIDVSCDGLHVDGGGVDVLYEPTQISFNGDWKAQGLAEAVYKKRLQDTELQYSQMLGHLRDTLKAPTD
jgi:hypothetical protein